MDIQNYGANCITITTKQARVVIDDNLTKLGTKAVAKSGDVVLFTTSSHPDPAASAKIIIDEPGEYEVSGVSIYGLAARAHMDEPNQRTATIYKLIFDDIRVLIVGHIYPELSDRQLESIGMVDVMIVPVGGNGYTLDGIGALKLVKKIEPKIIIPTHYEAEGVTYPVPQQTLQQALQGLGMEPQDTLSKLKLKSTDMTEATRLVVLDRS